MPFVIFSHFPDAGWARERALGDRVCGRWVAAVKVPGAYMRMTTRIGRVPQPRVPPLRMPAKMMRGATRCAILIGSRQLLEIELTRSQQTRKHFPIATFFDSLPPAPRLTHHSSLITASPHFYSIQIKLTESSS